VSRNNKPSWAPLSLTPDEAAWELRISKSELYKRINSGEIVVSRLGPQIVRIARSDVEAYLASQRDEPSGQPAA
jgi:excisionase family DNA binding protein